MAMQLAGIPAGWSGERIPLHSYVCFYYSDEDTLRRSLAFLRVGLDRPGEVCGLFADEMEQPYLVAALQEQYPAPLEDRIREGKLVVLGPRPTPEDLVVEFGDFMEAAVEAGVQVIRFLGYPGWGKPGWPAEEGQLRFEADLHKMVNAYPLVLVVCCCGLGLDGPPLLRGGFETHAPALPVGHHIGTPPGRTKPAETGWRKGGKGSPAPPSGGAGPL